MKKLMVLAAGLLQVPVIKKAREKGYYVIAVDDNPDAPGMTLADKAIVPGGLMNEEKLVEIAKEEHIDGVIHPCSEVAMNVMGRINNELGLSGVSKEQAIKATNKHLMREAFDRYGAPSVKSMCFSNVGVAWRSFCNDFHCDAILKPSRNSGSRGVAKIYSDTNESEFAKSFERAKEESRDKTVILEQFIEGPEFSVEIIVWNNQVNVLQVTDKKTTDAPHFVELGHNQPSLFPEHIVEAVKQAAIMGVKALEVDNCACHAEVKVQDGQAYIIEIGARLGGDFISTELTHLSTGIDMVGAAVDVAFGIEPDLKPMAKPQGVAVRYFAPKPGRVVAIENVEVFNRPDVYDAELYVKPGDEVREVKSSLDRSGHVIVTAPTSKEAIDNAEYIVDKVKIITI